MIMHKAYYKEEKIFYLCNQAVSIDEDKVTNHWAEVTCKNCLKQKPKSILEAKK